VFVAVEQLEVLGFALFRRSFFDHPFVELVYVRAERRRCGLGERLLLHTRETEPTVRGAHASRVSAWASRPSPPNVLGGTPRAARETRALSGPAALKPPNPSKLEQASRYVTKNKSNGTTVRLLVVD
jgi:GNAT superfamily N-acetyltransferase